MDSNMLNTNALDSNALDSNTSNILAKVKIIGLRTSINYYIDLLYVILETILSVLFFICALFIPYQISTLLLIYPILILAIYFVIKYIKQEINTKIDNFEDDVEFCITGKANYKLFQRMIKDLDRNKYHIYRELDKDGYIKDWAIFRKDMEIEKYFSKENRPLLTSKENDMLDLINFVAKEKENAIKRNKKTNGQRI